MNQKKELIKNTIIISIGKFSTRVVSFILLPLYTALLSKSEYGSYDLLNTISIFLIPIITLQLEEGMFRFLIDAKSDEEKSKIFTQTIVYITISFIISSLLIILFSNLISYKYGYYLVGYLFGSIIFNITTAFARGESRWKLYSFLSFINSFINIVLNVLFIAVFKWGLVGLFLAYIISCVIIGIYGLFKLGAYKYLNRKYLDKKTMNSMVKYAFPLVPNNISWHAISLSDRLIITNILNVSANGIYSVANKFPTIINTCYGFFNVSWRESASKMVLKEERDEFYNSVYINLKHFLMTSSILVVAFLPFVFNILINSNFNEAYAYIPLMILSTYYANMSNFSSGIFAAYKDNKVLVPTTIVAAILNLIIGFVFIKKIGLFAPILGTLVSYAVINIYRNYKLRKYLILAKDKFAILNYLVFIIVSICYYTKIIWFELLALVLALGYFYFLNRGLLKTLFNRSILKKFKKGGHENEK